MAFLDDDEQAFQAALSFVEEFALDKQGAEGPQVPTQYSTPVAIDSEEYKQRRRKQVNERKKLLRKAGVYADPNRVRSERRQEVARLREQLEKLHLDVQVLRRREVKPRSLIAAPTAHISPVWQELAIRQRHRREEAELENLHLKRAVERQRQVAGELSDLMRKRARLVTKECSAVANQRSLTHHVVAVLDVGGDMPEDFRVLLLHLKTAYQGMDALFAANGLASWDLPPGDVHLREGTDGRFLECFSYKMLPFAAHAATEVTWEHFRGVEKHLGNGSLYQKAAKNLDEPYTIIEDFTKELHSNTSRADIKVKQVVRRYVEEDRDVVIWVARVAPAEIKHKLLHGLTYHLRGYAVTKQHANSTLLQQCSLISLDQDADAKLGLTDLHTLTNFLNVNAAQNIRAHRERIENMLMDRTIAA